uniref:Uncharacterized protein n=1 Tax=Rhizophora mucronata TaxID=61149 RepID=A0A2P2KQ18_RHIMU
MIECGTFRQRTAPQPAYSDGRPPLVIIPMSAFLQGYTINKGTILLR